MPMGVMYQAPRGGKYKKKKLPMATKKVDISQNRAIISLNSKINKINRYIETKYKDTMHNGLALTPAPTLALLNGLVIGDTESTRTANIVKGTSLQFKATVQTDPDNLFGNVCRIIILWDRQPNGVAPVFSDVLDTNVVTSATSNTVYAPYNIRNSPRFKILKDKMFTLNGQNVQTVAAGATSQQIPLQSHPIRFRIPLARETNYGLTPVGGAGAGTIADISSNALYGLYLSNQPTGSQPPVLYAGIRFLYKDA